MKKKKKPNNSSTIERASKFSVANNGKFLCDASNDPMIVTNEQNAIKNKKSNIQKKGNKNKTI